MTEGTDPIASGFIPYDLRPGPASRPDYSDPSVPLPPLPEVRRTPLGTGEVLVAEPWEDSFEWFETEGYGRVVPRPLWNEYKRLLRRLGRIEAQMAKGEVYDSRPIPTDEERRAALRWMGLLSPLYTPLRNQVPRSRA